MNESLTLPPALVIQDMNKEGEIHQEKVQMCCGNGFVYPVTTRRHVTWMNVKCIGLGRGSLYVTFS